MVLRRTILVFCAFALAAAGVAWMTTASPVERLPLERMEDEQPYTLDAAFDRAQFDLDFREHRRYLLIVGSLSDDHRPHAVTLKSSAVETPAALPARHIAPLAAPTIVSTDSERRLLPPRVEPQPQQKGATSRSFHLHVTDGALDDARQYARVKAKLIAAGRGVRVYLDRQQQERELAAGLADEIVHLLEDDLLPALREQVAAIRDVDGDENFTVLLTPWLGRLQGGKTSLGGFVRESDFRSGMEPPYSNHCDMLYLNSNVTPGPHLKTLLAHELMHASSFSARLPTDENPNGLPEEEDWLNEAIAHLSENLNGDGWSNLDYRVSRFLSQPEAYPLAVRDYYHAGLWRNHGCRGATYLFLRWCADQFGVGVLEKIIRAPGRGRENLAHATGVKFDELFRRWTVALALSNRCAADEDSADVAADEYGYRTLDIRGRLASWGLAGPRPVRWSLNEGDCTLQLAGTAAAFVLIEADRAAGGQRIHIRGEFGTELQVTLIRLRDDALVIEPQINWCETSGAKRIAIDVPVSATGECGLERVSFERNADETRETLCFCGAALDERRVTAPAAASQRFEFRLPDSAQQGGWLAKVVSRDALGNRSCAFVDVPAAQSGSAPLRVAGRR